MKLRIPCTQCATEAGKITVENDVVLEIRNDGLYNFTCKKGHKSVVALPKLKFEILFEIGGHAILDGYYREAVSCFSASLERFYEFYTKVICLSRNIEEEQFQKAWKQVSRQSERQLGAFIYLYLIETGRTPKLLSSKWREFRNNVIHKGLIPGKNKAVEYGQTVLDLMLPVLNEIKTNHQAEVGKTVLQHQKRISLKATGGFANTVMSLRTIISIWAEESGTKKLDEELSRLAKN